MDWNLFSHPSVLLTALGTLVAIVVWFVRLEQKANEAGETAEDLKGDLKDLRGVVNTHRENADIHFNPRLQKEIDRRHVEHNARIEGRLKQIEGKLDDLLKR